MPTRLIFICHGQLPHEKPKGLALAKLIDDTPGFRAFFAENVHSTDGLSQHIFGNLERCDGFLAVMHKRGEVTFPGGKLTRASVWIHQELAIVSFINYQRHASNHIKVRVFAERGIDREGLADTLILNPIEFERDEQLPDLVLEWLTGPDFAEDAITATREELFRKLTSGFTETHWKCLEVMMVLSGGTTDEVDESNVRSMLGEMKASGDIPGIHRELAIKGFLRRTDRPDFERGITPTALTLGFIDLIADELRRRGSRRSPRG